MEAYWSWGGSGAGGGGIGSPPGEIEKSGSVIDSVSGFLDLDGVDGETSIRGRWATCAGGGVIGSLVRTGELVVFLFSRASLLFASAGTSGERA